MAKKWDARRASIALSVVAAATAGVLALSFVVSNAVSTVNTGAAFAMVFVTWLLSVVLIIPIVVAAVIGIVVGVRSQSWVAVAIGSFALIGTGVGAAWLLNYI